MFMTVFCMPVCVSRLFLCAIGDPAELHDNPRGHPGPAAGYRSGPREARLGGREAGSHPAGCGEQKVK